MTTIAPFRATTGATERRQARAVRGVGKPSVSLNFDGESAKTNGPIRVEIAIERRRQASQSETDMPASFWNGPRLTSAFAAQVLGQILDTGAHAQKAAYGAGAPLPRRLHDRRY